MSQPDNPRLELAHKTITNLFTMKTNKTWVLEVSGTPLVAKAIIITLADST
jgi:hypothetical protein